MSNILIKSIDRDSSSTSSSDFKLKLIDPIKGCYRVRNIVIPNNIYNVNSNNSRIYFTRSTAKTATLTEGFYSSSTIGAEVKSKMNTADGTSDFDVSVSSATGKITITNASNNFTLTFGTNTTISASEILGFDNEDTASASSQTGDSPINLSKPYALSIVINDIINFQNLNPSNSVFGSIYVPLNVSSQEVLYWEPEQNDNNYLIEFPSSTKLLTVKVFDSDNQAVNIQSNWELLLEKIN